MIEWISEWAEAIIVAVIIATIIEMILPEGNSKKYIKVVIGIYVLFTIITPIINKFTNKNVEVSDILDLDKYIEEAEESVKMQNTIQDNNQSSIMGMYSSGLKDDMKAKIEAKGYVVNNIDIDIADDESYTIEGITLKLENEEKSKEIVENVNTSSGKDESIENKVEEVETVNKVEISIGDNSEDNVDEDNAEEKESEKKNELSSSQKKELKEYLSGIYEVSEDRITIN